MCLRVLLVPKAIAVVSACLMLLAPVSSFAQSRYAWPEEQRGAYRTPVEVWLSGEGWDEDYRSSHVCINGYRWMTRNVEHSNASAADDAIPVRC
jgi:hypothetical protein